MIIKILGSGCKKCVALGENAKAAAAAAGKVCGMNAGSWMNRQHCFRRQQSYQWVATAVLSPEFGRVAFDPRSRPFLIVLRLG